MRKSVVVVLGTFFLFSGLSHADDGSDDAANVKKEVQTVRVSPIRPARRGMPLANWKPPAEICVPRPSSLPGWR